MEHKEKLAVVAYPVGRVGATALMGLLRIAGFDPGDDPRGCFDLPEQQLFLRNTYKGIYPEIAIPPCMETVDLIGAASGAEYRSLIAGTLGSRLPAAVKSQWFLTIPFLKQMEREFDIRVLNLTRNLGDQVSSILRVWSGSDDLVRRCASRDYVIDYVLRWRQFGYDVLKWSGLSVLDLSFDRLMNDPVKVSGEICQFLDVDRPDYFAITHCFDPEQVNGMKPGMIAGYGTGKGELAEETIS